METQEKGQKGIDRRKFVKITTAGIMSAGLTITGLKNVDAILTRTDTAQNLLIDLAQTPLKKVTVVHIRTDMNINLPIVLLQNDEEKILPIWIGQAEASAIQLALQGQKPPRPMSHDLMRSLLEAAEAKILQGVITEIKNATFYGLLFVQITQQQVIAVDCRPSDAIALCLRTKSPILVSEQVLNESAVTKDNIGSIQSTTMEFGTSINRTETLETENRKLRTLLKKHGIAIP